MTILFDKLNEHELELEKLKEKEQGEKKNSIALKFVIKKSKKCMEEKEMDNSNGESMNYWWRSSQFLKYKNKNKNKIVMPHKSYKKQDQRPTYTCYEYHKVILNLIVLHWNWNKNLKKRRKQINIVRRKKLTLHWKIMLPTYLAV